MLKIKNLRKSFVGKVVLDECSFNVDEKKVVSLVGPNGCGKTTLFNIVSGLLKSDFGDIVFNDINLCKFSAQKIANLKITRTFQDPKLFKNLTVYEHLVLSVKYNCGLFRNVLGLNSLSSEDEKKIDSVLKLLELDKKRDFIPQDLSGGQRKLLDLGVALVRDFDLILLDEPIAGVSPRLRRLIANVVLSLKKTGKTVFLIEHDMNFVMKVSDEVVVLYEGKVLKKGKPSDIKKDKKVLKAYLGG